VTGDERFDMPDLFEMRVLERHNGKWLIVYLSVLALRSGPADHTRILVDQDGHIVWAAESTLKALKEHPHLTISAGRFRATRPVWDKVLQDAIKRASKVNHLTQFEKDVPLSPGHLVFPVILGEDDHGGVQSCIVYARDGGTYVAFDDGHQVERSLELAKNVFGLSDAQTRLAETITAGFGLTESAKKMGISVNTARTHLSRIYEKTGVNSQTALVRILLGVSIAGP
jgi:DNA-binding CsgD family transcriptional regulator